MPLVLPLTKGHPSIHTIVRTELFGWRGVPILPIRGGIVIDMEKRLLLTPKTWALPFFQDCPQPELEASVVRVWPGTGRPRSTPEWVWEDSTKTREPPTPLESECSGESASKWGRNSAWKTLPGEKKSVWDETDTWELRCGRKLSSLQPVEGASLGWMRHSAEPTKHGRSLWLCPVWAWQPPPN